MGRGGAPLDHASVEVSYLPGQVLIDNPVGSLERAGRLPRDEVRARPHRAAGVTALHAVPPVRTLCQPRAAAAQPVCSGAGMAAPRASVAVCMRGRGVRLVSARESALLGGHQRLARGLARDGASGV